MHVVTPKPLGRGRTDERGVILVWLAVMMVVLLGMGALGIDIAHLYQVKTDAQKAADAAALAGAVYLPDTNARAVSQATAIAQKNGFATDSSGTGADSSRPSQMNVKVTKRVDNFLAGVLGITQSTVTAKASAEYLKPTFMGSPTNQFGNDPDRCSGQHGTTCYPDFWANIAGKQSNKQSGDRFTAESCAAAADNCSGPNQEYDPNGHIFTVEVNTPGTLRVEVFDPAFVYVGDHCEKADGDLDGIATAAPTYGLTAARYAKGDSSYCSGDVDFTATVTNDQPSTTYTLRSPGTLPPSPTTSPAITSCGTPTFPGTNGNLRAHFVANDVRATNTPTTLGFRDYFRRWTTICTVPGATAGTYFLQVQAPSGNGHNRFAIRATVNGSASGVQVHGYEHMAIYANAPAANTTFHLARIPTNAANHTLVVDLFDIGDAPNGSTGTLSLIPPSGSTFGTCTFRKGVNGSVNTAPGCSVGNVYSTNGYQGAINQFRITIPSNYRCNDSDPNDCWVKLRLAFTQNVEDTTTWSARLEGDPVRITK
jgi:Flp pilus assembly protein TadG